jgi:hypothetical protein
MARWGTWIFQVVWGVLLLLVLGAVVIALRLGVHDGVVTAVATAVIGCFTITLGITGWFQLRHAQEVDRAYLTAGGDLDLDTVGQKIFRFEIENIGRSAAFVTSYDVQFATWNQVRLPLPARPVNELEYIHDDRLGPAGSTRSSFKAIPTETLRPAVADVVYGAVWYTDIWRRQRRSRFILSIDRNDHTRADVGNVDARYREWT